MYISGRLWIRNQCRLPKYSPKLAWGMKNPP